MALRIGNTEFSAGLALAPMAGFSDRAMRLVAAECGAELAVTEMVSAKAIVFSDKKTISLAKIEHDEMPTLLQIFGKEPDIMSEAVGRLIFGDGIYKEYRERYRMPLGIDINMGCPVHKIFSNGEGSALMRSPELIFKIVSSVRSATALPLGVKLRLGVDESHMNVIECALASESAGADYITVHGRTRTQMYSGKCNIEMLAEVKNSLHIPMIANGDITDVESAMHMFSCVKCDGIMIGRGAVGNPFIFREIAAALRGEECKRPTLEERKTMAIHQLRLAVIDKGEAVAIPESRKQIAMYFKGEHGAAALRGKINSLSTLAEVEECIRALGD